MEPLINLIKADQEFFIQLGAVILLLAILLSALQFLLGKKRWFGLGKVLGFCLGFLVARAPGALVGLLFGHAFDLAVEPKRVRVQKNQKVRTPLVENVTDQSIYLETLFSTLGNFSQVSGTITTAHLNQFHTLADQLRLSAASQRNMWDWFQYGQHADFNVRQALFTFSKHSSGDVRQVQAFMHHLLDFAEKNQPLNAAQYAILCQVAYALNLSTESFAHLAPAAKAESKHKSESITDNPYKILGLEPTATNKEIKWAYRKLMGRYHPDRLISKDLPEDLIQLATKRTQEIKDAYDKLSEERGI